MPVDDGGEHVFLRGGLQAHEPVGENEVSQDIPGGMDLEVARGQGGDVGLEFLLAQVLGREAADFLHEQAALLLLNARSCGAGTRGAGL